MKKKIFVTIHRISKNVDLLKDVGMIPYIMAKYYDFSSKLVCEKNEESYSYWKEYVSEINLEFLPSNKNGYFQQLLYVAKNASKIDVLNMYHLSIHNSLLVFLLYKVINKNGLSYLKLDLDFRGINKIENYSFFKKVIIKFMLRFVDVVSAESRAICKRFESMFKKTTYYIPNGYYHFCSDIKDSMPQKKNIFLTVGRLGTEQKNTILLLQTYLRLEDSCDWKLILVGSIEPELQKYLYSLYSERPELCDKIIYKGEIIDKSELEHEYKEAKIFILPSKWESFGLVAVEALAQGCYLVLSDAIPPAYDITNEGKCGIVFQSDNSDELRKAMYKSTQIDIDTEKIINFAENKFCWNEICNKLNNVFENKKKDRNH